MSKESKEHISGDLLERFFREQLSRKEAQKLVRHLLTNCPQCRETAALVRQRSGWIASGEGRLNPGKVTYTIPSFSSERPDILRRLEEETLAHERLQGAGLFDCLEELPPEERLLAIQLDPRFHQVGLFKKLLVEYLEAAREEPKAGISLVILALAIVDLLPEERFKSPILNDFRAAGMAALANAERLAGFFEDSKKALETAWEYIEEGTGDPLEEANLLSIEASLWRDLGQLDRSARILDRAIQIYRQVGDNNRCARMLVQKGLAMGYADPVRGIKILQDALVLMDIAKEPRLELCAQHNLALFLADAGYPQQALDILERTRPLYQAFNDNQTQLLLRWLEARIARSLGNLPEAESVLKEITGEFERRGMPYERVVAAVDLVQVHSSRESSPR